MEAAAAQTLLSLTTLTLLKPKASRTHRKKLPAADIKSTGRTFGAFRARAFVDGMSRFSGVYFHDGRWQVTPRH